jgi:hypothetical protein
MHENGHNSARDQDFPLKLAPLHSAQTELSIHTKISLFMKNYEQSLFLEQVTNIVLQFYA